MEKLQIINLSLVVTLAVMFSLYMYNIIKKYGWINSISKSYYKLRTDHKSYLFTGFMVLQGFGIFIITCNEVMSITGILMGLGVWIVAVSPIYENPVVRWPHYIGAGMSFIAAHFNMIFYEQYILFGLSLLTLIILIITFRKRNFILLLCEMEIFIIIYLALGERQIWMS